MAALLCLLACSPENAAVADKPADIIRGLKGYRIAESSGYETRRYPTIVRPSQESKLAFEIAGQLNKLNLEIGQLVRKGQVLAEINPASLHLEVERSQATLAQAKANLNNARSDFERKSPLLAKGYITQSEYDAAQSALDSGLAQVNQMQQQLALSQQSLSKSVLLAPFEGTISSIDVEDYQQLSPGQTVLGLYAEGAFEIRFGVPASVVNSIHVNDVAKVNFSDLPGSSYQGVITELGARAGKVSAFPVVLVIENPPPGLRAGMAADVELSIALNNNQDGFLIPISCFSFDGPMKRQGYRGDATIYVYDEQTSTVQARVVFIEGVLDNRAIISKGLAEGEIVAAAGVSFLYDTMAVKLLPLNN